MYARSPIETAFPGTHAFDESYTEMTIELCGKTLVAHCDTGERRVYTTGKTMVDYNIPVQTACLCVKLEEPVAFSTGGMRSVAEVQKLLDERKAEYDRKIQCFGAMQEMYKAMECALAWDTIYDAKNDRVISPVSRLWSVNSGGYVLFGWDNFFAGFMAALGNSNLAYSNLREILNEQTKDGFVPNFAYATGQVSADRSQPPVGSAMLLETYRLLGDKWIVEDMYPDLLKWNRWFEKHRMNESGALCWGSEQIPVLYGNRWETEGVHETFGAALESGLDNSPMYDDIPFNKERNRLELEDVGLTGLYILDCSSLIELAQVLGKTEDIPELKERMNRACDGLEGLWDEELGFYYNRRTDTGEFSRRISPTNFYALFSPRVSVERQRRIAKEHYYNSEEFYGEWMLPSIAHNDAAYAEQNYWRGRVWAPLNFLVYMALTRTELEDVRHDLAKKSEMLFMKEWTEHRHVHENYNSITGEGCDSGNSDKFYHWGALLCVIALADAGYIKNMGEPLNKG